MALSPIQLFQSDQNSLSQILAGGNQTVSGIMDRAIQIGRDISNKQHGQERDLMSMRQQQSALDQRRGESMQQDFEDTRRFMRGAFESDRRFGLEMQQEDRAGVKDLFSMGAETERIGLAERGLQLREGEFKEQRSARQSAEEAARAEREQLRRMLEGGGEPPLPETGSDADDSLLPPRGGTESDATILPPMVVEADRESDRAAKLERLGILEMGIKSKDLTQAERARYNAEYVRLKDELGADGTSAARPTDPLVTQKRELDVQAAQRKDRDARIDEILTLNPAAFDPKSSRDTDALMKLAVKHNKKPEDVLFSEAFEKRFGDNANDVRARIIAAQKSDRERELNAISSSTSEAEYVDKKRGISEALQLERRRLYRLVKGVGGSAGSAGSTTPPTSGSSPVRDLGL